MKSLRILTGLLFLVVAGTILVYPLRGQTNKGVQTGLPKDVYPDSRNRLPMIKRESLDESGRKAYDAAVNSSGGLRGDAEIRLHGGGENVRFESPLGHQLTELAILVNARESDAQFEWTLHEEEGLRQGLDPKVIEIVRSRKPAMGIDEKEAAIIELGREIVVKHKVSPATFAQALKLLGESNLVDIVSLMGQYTGTSAQLATVDQHLPLGRKLLLPVPETSPKDIYPDSRSRLPLLPSAPPNQAAAANGGRPSLAPPGTGPGEIGRHGGGGKFLQADLGHPLLELAILATAREWDQPYEWTLYEQEALKQGLDPKVIDIVRYRRSTEGLDEKQAVIIQMDREVFEKHLVASETYARAVKLFGERDVVDLAAFIGQHSAACAILTAFDQQLPAGQKATLPLR